MNQLKSNLYSNSQISSSYTTNNLNNFGTTGQSGGSGSGAQLRGNSYSKETTLTGANGQLTNLKNVISSQSGLKGFKTLTNPRGSENHHSSSNQFNSNRSKTDNNQNSHNTNKEAKNNKNLVKGVSNRDKARSGSNLRSGHTSKNKTAKPQKGKKIED